MPQQLYYTYILCSKDTSVLYTGMTNNLHRRLIEHWIGSSISFTTRYRTYYLLWYETDKYVLNAIAKEKEIKLLVRDKKEELIKELNPELKFLNESVLGHWPPTDEEIEYVKEYLKRNPSEFER